MADENKTPVKDTEASPAGQASKRNKFVSWCKKLVSWCKKLPGRIATPFRNMWFELKKVSWPSKQKLINCSIIVLVFMLCMGIVIGLFDMGGTALVKLLA